MRRYAFYGHFVDAVEGLDREGGWAIPFHDEQGHEVVLKRPVVVSKLRRVRPMCTEEFAYARGRTDRALKVTLINAQQAAAYYDADKSRGAYPTIDAYLADVVDILRARGGRAGAARLHLHPARRAAVRRLDRPDDPRGLSRARHRSRTGCSTAASSSTTR